MHDVVIVIGENVDEQMAPYREFEKEHQGLPTFDYYVSHDMYLRLKQRPRGAASPVYVDHASLGEIDADHILKNPPSAVVIGGRWESWPDDVDSKQAWIMRLADILSGLPTDTTVTALDVHS